MYSKTHKTVEKEADIQALLCIFLYCYKAYSFTSRLSSEMGPYAVPTAQCTISGLHVLKTFWVEQYPLYSTIFWVVLYKTKFKQF